MSIFLKKGSRVQVGFPSEVTPFHLMVDDLLFMYIIMKYIEAFHGFLYIFYSSLARVLLNLIIKKSHIYIQSEATLIAIFQKFRAPKEFLFQVTEFILPKPLFYFYVRINISPERIVVYLVLTKPTEYTILLSLYPFPRRRKMNQRGSI